MYKFSQRGLYLLFALAITFAQMANAGSACPSDIVKPFVGEWQGHALLIHVDGSQDQSATRASYVQIDCQSFGATFNYLDDAGNVVRTIHFTASPDPEQAGSFTINDGTTSDKSGSTPVTGTFRQAQDGTLLGTFLGALQSKPVYMTELMNVTEPQSGVRQLVRTVQMFAGRGGSYIASRVDSERSK